MKIQASGEDTDPFSNISVPSTADNSSNKDPSNKSSIGWNKAAQDVLSKINAIE